MFMWLRVWLVKRLLKDYILFFRLNDSEYYYINEIVVDMEYKQVILSMVDRE